MLLQFNDINNDLRDTQDAKDNTPLHSFLSTHLLEYTQEDFNIISELITSKNINLTNKKGNNCLDLMVNDFESYLQGQYNTLSKEVLDSTIKIIELLLEKGAKLSKERKSINKGIILKVDCTIEDIKNYIEDVFILNNGAKEGLESFHSMMFDKPTPKHDTTGGGQSQYSSQPDAKPESLTIPTHDITGGGQSQSLPPSLTNDNVTGEGESQSSSQPDAKPQSSTTKKVVLSLSAVGLIVSVLLPLAFIAKSVREGAAKTPLIVVECLIVSLSLVGLLIAFVLMRSAPVPNKLNEIEHEGLSVTNNHIVA